MKSKPFQIKSILFDFLLCMPLALVTQIIGVIIIAFVAKKDSEEAMGFSFYISIPLWAIFFYIIRGRFNFKTTLIQILMTSLATLSVSYLFIILENYLPKYVQYKMGFLLPTLAITVFILTKHLSDKYILSKNTHSNTNELMN